MVKKFAPLVVVALVGLIVGYVFGSRGGGGGGARGATIAVVNGDPISEADLLAHLRRKNTVTAIIQGQVVSGINTAGTLGLLGLEDLVRQRIVMQLAKDQGVWPTEADVERELQLKKDQDPRYVSTLNQSGLTLEQIKQSLRIDLAFENLITKGQNVTMEDVERYLQDNPNELIEPAQIGLLIIQVQESDREAVDQALRQGEQFNAVAARYNVNPQFRSNRGQFPVSVRNELRANLQPEVFEIIDNTPELRTTDWIRFGDTWAKFYVERRTEEREIEPDAKMKERMRRALAVRRGQMANDVGRQIVNKLRDSIRDKTIIIEDSVLKFQWDRLADQILDAEQAADATAAGQGATSEN